MAGDGERDTHDRDAETLLGLLEGLSARGVVPRSVTVGSVSVEIASTDWAPRGTKKSEAPRPGTHEWYRDRVISEKVEKAGGDR